MDTSVPLILSVDDDPLFQRFVSLSLRRMGFELMSAPDGMAGCECLERTGSEAFSCVLIDRRMPRMDGLEFLEWLRARDPNLSAILVTAEMEVEHLEQTLAAGTCTFLEKPLTAETLRIAVAHASKVTKQRRQLTQLRENVHRYGRHLRDTIASLPTDEDLASESFYLPKHEAGGDFLVKMKVSEDQQLILLTDVSGHDLWSAQWSAYFHGFLNGSLRGGASVGETLMRFNVASVERAHAAENLSIAVCALLFDCAAQTMTIFYGGAPLPVWTNAEGSLSTIQAQGGPPLGWFADCGPSEITVPWPSGAVYLWTDGIDDLARALNASPLSIAQALLKYQQASYSQAALPAWVSDSVDDLLVTRVYPGKAPAADDLEPLLLANYQSAQIRDIDKLQEHWENSLRIALPELGQAILYAVLLCTREALINALTHGCAEGGSAKIRIVYKSSTNTLLVQVSDPGPGHAFAIEEHLKSDQLDLVEKHRGLMLIRSFATRTSTRRNGADFQMEFSLSEKISCQL
jgi:CheY-like chemotaxis protein